MSKIMLWTPNVYVWSNYVMTGNYYTHLQHIDFCVYSNKIVFLIYKFIKYICIQLPILRNNNC